MTDQTPKEFSAEDLDLLKDAEGDKSGDADGGDTNEAQDSTAKDEVVKSDTGMLFDDLDDDVDEKPSDTKSDTDSKKADEPEGKKDGDKKPEEVDWRDAFISKALAGQENKITAAKLADRTRALKRDLSRYKSQEDYMLAGLAAREKLRSGEYKRARLPDDATDDEVTAWRKENGIPEKPEAYEIPKIAGHKWMEADDPFIESFKGVAHSANFSQDQLNAASKWYADTMAEQQDTYLQTTANMDKEDRETTRDTLRAEIGNSDYKPSLILMERLLKDEDVMPNGIGEKMMSARYYDDEGKSRRLINNPDMARMLINMARDTYGDAAMISGDARTTMSNRKKEIEDLMNSDIQEYYRRGWDKELLEIAQKEDATSRRRGK